MKHILIIAELLISAASCIASADAGPFDLLLTQAKYSEFTRGEVRLPEPTVDELPAYNEMIKHNGKLMVISRLGHVPQYAKDLAVKEARKVVHDRDGLFPDRGIYRINVVGGEPYFHTSMVCDESGKVLETKRHARPPSNWEAQQTVNTSSSMDTAWSSGAEVRQAYGSAMMSRSYSMPLVRSRGLFSRRASGCVGGS